jgi:hypothetical protein
MGARPIEHVGDLPPDDLVTRHAQHACPTHVDVEIHAGAAPSSCIKANYARQQPIEFIVDIPSPERRAERLALI